MKMIHMFFLVLHSFGRLTMYKSTANSFTSKHLLSLYLYLISDLTFCAKEKKATWDQLTSKTFQSHSLIYKNLILLLPITLEIFIVSYIYIYRFVFRTKFLCAIKIPLHFCQSKYLIQEVFNMMVLRYCTWYIG